MKINREFKIGVFAVFAVVIFVWGLNYLKGNDIFTRSLIIYSIYDDVTDLDQASPVSMNGVVIGQVRSIKFMEDGSGRIIVSSSLSPDLSIPANSKALLTDAGFIGGREIFILRGDSSALIKSGDTLQSVVELSLQNQVSQMVGPVINQTEEVFVQLDSILRAFNSVFNYQTRNDITQSFSGMRATVDNLESATYLLDKTIANESERIASILANAESLTQNLNNNNALINNIIQNFSNISDSVAAANIQQTLLLAEESLKNLNLIVQKIERGEGTMGLLVNDQSLYNNLSESALQLELLLEDIRNNPGKYINISVFGRRQP